MPKTAHHPDFAPRRIVIVRLSHLGDLVHALPVYHALRSGYPGAELAWVVQEEFAELVERLPGLSRCVRFERRGGAFAWTRLRAQLTDFGAEWCVDAQGNVKSAMASLASGAGRRTGMHRSDWTERFAAHAMTDTAPPTAPPTLALARSDRVHALDRMRNLALHLSPVGDATDLSRTDAPRMDPELSAHELERGEALWRERLPGIDRDACLLHLSAAQDPRSWPPASFARLARALAGRGRTVLLLSGPAEREVGQALQSELAGQPCIRHWVGQRGLRDLAGFFRAAARRAAQLVVCDSGPMHLAVACGLPVVALEGPQDHRLTGPWPVPPVGVPEAGPHAVLRAALQPDCAPCRARHCVHPGGAVCMTKLDPDQVLGFLAAQRRESPAGSPQPRGPGSLEREPRLVHAPTGRG